MNITIFKRKALTFINNPKILPIKILYKISPLLKDEDYLTMLFPLKTGYPLNLDNPKTYNEKLQWLKINYRKPIMTQMVDKYDSKSYAGQIIGDEYIIETYGVWDSFEEIDFDELPNQFVLKTTHDQGGVVIVHDKENFDYKSAQSKLSDHLNTKHYYLTREWPYKNVKPRILAERLLTPKTDDDLMDYKFYCFDGEPKLMYISHGRQSATCHFDFYDMSFQKLDINRPSYPQSDIDFKTPINWDLMIDLASQLSKGFPHLRVDFYNIDGKVYLGEMTFFQGGGMMPFNPFEWDLKLGEWINLEKLNQ